MSDPTTKTAVVPYEPAHPGESFFSSTAAFNHGQRMAGMLAQSDLVPKAYKGNVANCFIALGMAQKINADPILVMQNLHLIQGRPSWGASFLIATLNTCGRFTPLQYKMEDLGTKKVTYSYWTGTHPNREKKSATVEVPNFQCIAFAKDKNTGEILESPPVSCEMAVVEGWWTKTDSKWPSMYKLMLRYRAAAFFVRIYAPELSMGMKTVEESEDFTEFETVETTPKRTKSQAAAAIIDMPVSEPVDEKEAEEYAESKAEPEPEQNDASTETPGDDDDKDLI